MERPVGVTILAVLCFLGAAGSVLGDLAMGAVSALAGAHAHTPLGGLIGLGGTAAAIVMFLLAALDLAVGIGLLKLQEWARITLLVLTAIGAAFVVVGFVGSLLHPIIFMLIYQLIVLAIEVWVIVYLMRASTKAAFRQIKPVASAA